MWRHYKQKNTWWPKILSCWWNWKISNKPAASPWKSAWDWNWNDFFCVASILIISMFLSRGLKTINVIYNTSNTVPLPQNNWWYLGQESISSWIRVSSSSLKRLLLCWQLTHSGPPKVYPRNRLKEQSWSKKLCPWHLDHKHTLRREGCFIVIHIEAVLFKCMAPKHDIQWPPFYIINRYLTHCVDLELTQIPAGFFLPHLEFGCQNWKPPIVVKCHILLSSALEKAKQGSMQRMLSKNKTHYRCWTRAHS